MDLQELLAKNFPSNGSFIIFLLYMGMFVAQVLLSSSRQQINICSSRAIYAPPDQYMLLQGMLVTASRYGGSDYSYNTVTVVLLTESVKLVLSSAVYVKDKTAASLGEGILKNKKVDHGHGD